jgi:hypothetical protein
MVFLTTAIADRLPRQLILNPSVQRREPPSSWLRSPSCREICDLVHGKIFAAGCGNEGYHPNVHTFIKRIRKKLCDVALEFAGGR